MQLKFIVSLIPYVLLIILKLKESIYVLSDNKYNLDKKYNKWLNSNVKDIILDSSILFITLLLGIIIKNNLIIMTIFIIICMIVSLLSLQKIKNQKNLTNKDYEKNNKIIFCISMIIYVIPSLIMCVTFKELLLIWYYLVLGLLIYINYFVIMIANLFIKKEKK